MNWWIFWPACSGRYSSDKYFIKSTAKWQCRWLKGVGKTFIFTRSQSWQAVLCTQEVYGKKEDIFEMRRIKAFIKYTEKHFLYVTIYLFIITREIFSSIRKKGAIVSAKLLASSPWKSSLRLRETPRFVSTKLLALSPLNSSLHLRKTANKTWIKYVLSRGTWIFSYHLTSTFECHIVNWTSSLPFFFNFHHLINLK